MSGSVFNLLTHPADEDVGSSNARWTQMPPKRNITGDTFSAGPIHFQHSSSRVSYLIPGRSYFRMRFQLLVKAPGVNTRPVQAHDGIAPCTNFAHHLFQSAEWRIGDKTVSRINDYVPQVGALDTRLNKSAQWLKTVGAVTNFCDYNFENRAARITTSRELSRQRPNCLGLFRDVWASLVLDQNGGVTRDVATIAFTPGDQDPYGFGGAVNVPGNELLLYNEGSIQINNNEAGTVDVSNALFVQKVEQFKARARNEGWMIGSVTSGGVLYDFTDLTAEPTLDPATAANSNWVFKVARGLNSTKSSNEDMGGDTSTSYAIYAAKDPAMLGAPTYEICFQLPLSIFNVMTGIPACTHDIILHPMPSSSLKAAAFQTKELLPRGAELQFVIEDMYLQVYEVDGRPVDNTEFLLDLEQINCRTETMKTQGFIQKTFEVSPSTRALTLAFQDSRTEGLDSRLNSAEFVIYDPSLQYKVSEGLNRFYIQYAGQQYPSPDADPRFSRVESAPTQQLTERYMQTLMNTGAYFSDTPESFDEFVTRGPFFYFQTPRDGSDASRQVTVAANLNVSSATDLSQARMLLFDHAKQLAKVTIQNGVVTNVQLEWV
jgi:hypothetical protein